MRAVMGEMGSKEGLDIDSGGITRLADSLERGRGEKGYDCQIKYRRPL